jgi:hypothetical protein
VLDACQMPSKFGLPSAARGRGWRGTVVGRGAAMRAVLMAAAMIVARRWMLMRE